MSSLSFGIHPTTKVVVILPQNRVNSHNIKTFLCAVFCNSMSVNTNATISDSKMSPPLGLKILCIANILLSILGFFAVSFIFPSILPPEITGVGIILIGIVTVLNIGLLFFLYHGNRIAYYIYVALLTLNVIGSVFSFDIIGLIIQGGILVYLLLIKDYFES